MGGIFGLCLGGSFISLFEIVYFVLIRIVGTIALKYSKKEGAANLTPKVFIIPNKVVQFNEAQNYTPKTVAHWPVHRVDFRKHTK